MTPNDVMIILLEEAKETRSISERLRDHLDPKDYTDIRFAQLATLLDKYGPDFFVKQCDKIITKLSTRGRSPKKITQHADDEKAHPASGQTHY